MYTIKECSPRAKAMIKSFDDAIGASVNEHHRTKYPFDELTIGQSFTVPILEANESSMRLSATRKGKETGKTFTVIKHRDFNCIEVARIK